jgi:nicotinate-nucleotide pyrophosphorylase (carboxylating)
MNYLTEENINTFIQAALLEDIAEGDHTSLSTIPESAEGKARLLVMVF